MLETHLDTLIAELYEAAAGVRSWTDPMDTLDRAVDGCWAYAFSVDLQDHTAAAEAASSSVIPEVYEVWRDEFAAAGREIRLERARAQPSGAFYTEADLFADRREYETAPFVRYLRDAHGLYHVLGTTLEREAGRLSLFAVQRSEASGPFTADHLGFLRRAAPHMRRAFRLHQSLGGQQLAAPKALLAIPQPALLLDASGRMVDANAAGHAVLARRDCLLVSDQGRLAAAARTADGDLVHAVSSVTATRERGGVPTALVGLPRPNGALPLSLMLYALPPLQADLLGAAVLGLVRDPAERSADRHRALCTAFGLSAPEARLVHDLMDGQSLEEHAAARGVTVNTARTHLRRAFEKTGTNRQGAVIALCHRLFGQA